jgi:hypothetical protein
MSNDRPEIHWAKRFSRLERLFLAVYFCSIPILISGLLIYEDALPPGYIAMSLSVLGVVWVDHRLGRRRYAITGETMNVDLAPIARWRVQRLEVPLPDILFIAVKRQGIKVNSKVMAYYQGGAQPVVFDFLSSYEALAASKILAYYAEIKKAEANADLPHPEDG